jgi:hypothetical protein
MNTIADLFPRILDQKIPLKVLDISPRNFNYWKNENIIYEAQTMSVEDVTKRKWVYLNVYEALWLLIVKELRAWNIEFEIIKEIKKYLFLDIEHDFEKLKKKIFDEAKAIYLASTNDIASFNLPLEIEKKKISYSKISEILMAIFCDQKAISLVVNRDRVSGAIRVSHLETLVVENEFLNNFIQSIQNNTSIFIPLIPIFSEIFENENFEPYISKINFYSETELEIIHALNNDECKEIRISKHPSGDATLDFTFEKQVKGENVKKVKSIFGLNQYHSVNATLRNDKHLVIKANQKNIVKLK